MEILTIFIILFIIAIALIAYRINAAANDDYRRYRMGDLSRGQEKQRSEEREKIRRANAHLNKRPDESENNTEDRQGK